MILLQGGDVCLAKISWHLRDPCRLHPASSLMGKQVTITYLYPSPGNQYCTRVDSSFIYDSTSIVVAYPPSACLWIDL